jgi:hypothetical protein
MNRRSVFASFGRSFWRIEMVPLTTFEQASDSMPSERRHISSRLAFLSELVSIGVS